MKYIIMLLIAIGLIIVDYITGVIKAYITSTITSRKMRTGGLNKLSEILVMAASIGLEIGISELGKYYQSAELASVAGTVTASGVFIYIVIMELVSIFENYAAINPDAPWIPKFVERLKILSESDKED